MNPADAVPAPVVRPQTGRVAACQTLSLADDAASTGDYELALWWLTGIEAIGDRLPQEYVNKRGAWACAAALAREPDR